MKPYLILFICICCDCRLTSDMKIETRNGITLHYISYDPTVPESNINAYIETFFIVFPLICEDFDCIVITDWTLIIDPSYNGTIEPLESTMTIGANYSKANSDDVDLVTWGISYTILCDGCKNVYNSPKWFCNNLPDYSRYVYGVNNDAVNWTLKEFDPVKNENYTIGGTGTSSRFLVWIENHYPGVIEKAYKSVFNFDYTFLFWKTETNQTIDGLWSNYTKDPEIFHPLRNVESSATLLLIDDGIPMIYFFVFVILYSYVMDK